jgi:hypothetical protein
MRTAKRCQASQELHSQFTRINPAVHLSGWKRRPLVVEQFKTKREQRHYLNPELYGAAADQSIAEARFPASCHKTQTIQDVRNGINQAPKPQGLKGRGFSFSRAVGRREWNRFQPKRDPYERL